MKLNSTRAVIDLWTRIRDKQCMQRFVSLFVAS